MLLFKDIALQYLHMGKQVQEKHTLWQENNKYILARYINLMKDKV